MASPECVDAPNSWCRVCLKIDVRMHWVRNTRLLEIYEKLSSTKLNAEDGRPHTICYICYSQLQRCWRFSDMCHKSEQIQRELLLRGTERIPPRVTSNLSSYLQYNLSYPEVLDVKAEFVGVVKSDPEEHCERQFASALDVGLFGTTDTAEAPTAVTHNLAETALPFLSIIDYSNHTEGQVKEEPIDIEENTLVEDITVNDKIISSELLPVKVKSETNNVCALSFCCDVCNQTFAMNRKPAQHMLINFNKEQHACNMCNKTFTTGSNLNRHRRIHTGEKPYACSICNKSFRCSSELIKHKINHTGKKPYACNLCNKSFSHGKILETLLPDPNEVNRRNVLKVKHELTKIEKTRARIKKVGSVLKETTEVARKECKGCKAQKKRVQTIYECKHCEGSPGFCTKCFCLAHS